MFVKQLSTSKKIINSGLFILFTLFAVIQLNDPDPVLWFLIYLSVAIISLVSNFIVIPKFIISAIIVGFSIYAVMHFNFFLDWLQTEKKTEIFGEMVYEKPYLEGSREFIGLGLAIMTLLFQLKK